MTRRTKIVIGIIAVQIATVGALASPAMAWSNGCGSGTLPNCYQHWESGLGGIYHNGKVRIQGSYLDGGKHALRAYHRFQRDSGPALDTGRMYTTSSTSNSDATLRWREDRVTDSVLPGSGATTRWYRDIEWRSSGGGGGGCAPDRDGAVVC